MNPLLANVVRYDHNKPIMPQKYAYRVKTDYLNSWYHKQTKKAIKPTIEIKYDPWWLEWSKAAFIDALIERGVDIRI